MKYYKVNEIGLKSLLFYRMKLESLTKVLGNAGMIEGYGKYRQKHMQKLCKAFDVEYFDDINYYDIANARLQTLIKRYKLFACSEE